MQLFRLETKHLLQLFRHKIEDEMQLLGRKVESCMESRHLGGADGGGTPSLVYF